MALLHLLFFLFFLLIPPTLTTPDSEALLQLKKSFANAKALDSWVPGSSPCTGKIPWVGVVCFNGIITGLHLGQMGISGKIDIDALHEIPGIRTLSFVNNSFSGPIPEFNRIGALKAIYLSGNLFSGEIPSDFFLKMGSLKKLWLSGNRFTGEIPGSLAKLPRLIELHLENNRFSGSIPPIGQSTLKSLDMSNNKLEGEIPKSLSKFNTSSFAGNAGLCGGQSGTSCDQVVKDQPLMESDSHSKTESRKVAIAAVTLVVVILLLVVAAIVVMKRREEEFDVLGRENFNGAVEVHVSGVSLKGMESSRKRSDSNRKGSHNRKGTGVGDLVVVNEEKGVFGLPDLMKAAAEVLGNGGLGSAYKAVMSGGVAVVVKRMREMNMMGREGFDAEIRRLGKLRHPNILTPLAYHYRKEEKLLVSEFIPKGSLLYLLHGDRGSSHAELDWAARLKIVQGIARGMDYLHAELASSDLPHGNLKSGNVLLGSNYEPLLVDYGFSPLVTPIQATQTMFAYKSPEYAQFQRVSPKCDVYCLGIIILEILTGKFPSQYLNNGNGGTDVVQWVLSAISDKRESELFDPEIADFTNSLGEMERLLYIGAACTDSNPEKQLDMREATRRIEEIQVVVGHGHGYGHAEVSALSQSHASNVRDGYGEHSGRGLGQESFRSTSRRRDDDAFAFAIS
ncbi:hypothetical protein HHK36_014419 [Tetracentron sinense]|uniref:Protein kinase domain-containing protein n=1 Tax=Tetracentron sinense TaxID=13715 RepID=A0A834Z832_TETSI|nr:hypothetical protein HHK36_014419 [Tetracentron sinense]